MSGYPRWSDIRAGFAERARAEEAAEAEKQSRRVRGKKTEQHAAV